MLTRHRRTHETQQDGQPPTSFSDEDLENEENDFGSLDDGSPPDESHYLSTSFPNMANVTSMPVSSMGMQSTMPTMVHPSQVIQPQMLQHI